jgi:hypothetical protein
MQQDKNNIEDKLRQLDNQQLPDLSQMDGHWQAMKEMLGQAAIAPKHSNVFLKYKKLLFFAASAAAVTMLVWVATNNNGAEKGGGVDEIGDADDIISETVDRLARRFPQSLRARPIHQVTQQILP